MTVNKLKIIAMLLTTVALVLIFSAPTILADTELYYPIVVSITCNPGAPPTTNVYNIQETYPGDTVTFRITPSCSNVSISGDSPIGNFSLTTANPEIKRVFPAVGTYNYTITDNSQSPPQTLNAKIITNKPNYPAPSLSTWGIIILITLIIVTGVYLWMRRKPVTT